MGLSTGALSPSASSDISKLYWSIRKMFSPEIILFTMCVRLLVHEINIPFCSLMREGHVLLPAILTKKTKYKTLFGPFLFSGKDD